MSLYQALYRKWRPLSFPDVYGQEHVTATLKNQIIENKTGHAYLFTGTRGTGKTTCAKIFSRAVNCVSPKNGSPCNECPSCVGIMSGNILDVIEIDAASYSGVSDIRALREEVVFSPARVNNKVYIIDEVHMLSKDAWGALLKTLEEPPEHVVFILATTDIHKVPQTIISRCQRFDFKRIASSEIKRRLEFICNSENISIDDSALDKVARLADGSMRDGLSILEKLQASDVITVGAISQLLGSADENSVQSIIKSINENNFDKCISEFNNIYEYSKETELFCAELLENFRNILMIKASSSAESLVDLEASDFNLLKEIAESFSLQRIITSAEILSDALSKMPRSQNKRIDTELALLKLCDVTLTDTAAALISRIETLERKLSGGNIPLTNEILETPILQEKSDISPAIKEKKETKKPLVNNKPDFWKDVLKALKDKGENHIYTFIKSSPVSINEKNITISTDSDLTASIINDSKNNEAIKACVYEITGERYNVTAELTDTDDNDLFNELHDNIMKDGN